MHMIGISGRCAAERSSSSGLYPSPSTPAHVEGAHPSPTRKTGCQWMQSPTVFGGSSHYAMGVFNGCLEIERHGGVTDPAWSVPDRRPARAVDYRSAPTAKLR